MNSATKHLAEDIENYFFYHLDDLREGKRIHWLARHYLWFRDPFSRELLEHDRRHFMKPTSTGTRNAYKRLYNASMKHRGSQKKDRDHVRVMKRAEYPELSAINKLLFRSLFATTIFKQDTRSCLRLAIPKEHIRALRDRLLSNPSDIAVLSTPAVNFLSLTPWAYGLKRIPISFYGPLVANIHTANVYEQNRLLYLITHLIIGESLFYAKRITRDTTSLKRLLGIADTAIITHSSSIRLDIKIETLLCAKLLGKRMRSRAPTLREARNSQFDKQHPYVIDIQNAYKGTSLTSPSASEHRNILLVMLEGPDPKHLV